MNDTTPYLIVGLGNPGRQYAKNRHNVGFMLADRLADHLGTTFSRLKHHALVTDARYQGRKLILAKPQTYMNRSGLAVGALVQFYKIPFDHLLVAYDDLDLPTGALRLRPQGGSGGQKGMQSIIERLGTERFPRLRIGIGRPPGRMDAAAYVLQDFSAQEAVEIEVALQDAVQAVLTFVTEGLDAAMNRFNRANGQPD